MTFTTLVYCCISIHSLRMEGDDVLRVVSRFHEKFQSTPSVWRETSFHNFRFRHKKISIHSLRMEGDLIAISLHTPFVISIHSLRMEGDCGQVKNMTIGIIFQSTPSVWRETAQFRIIEGDHKISIHSLRMEGDSPGRIDR